MMNHQTIIYIYLYEMKITKIQQSSKQPTNQTKATILPQAYQFKHYPYDGLLERLAFMLIRPPRFIYNPDILKPNKRIRQRFSIETFSIPFQLTFYKQKQMKYVILYMHGNGSSRFQGTLFLAHLPENIGLACFDFCGCGNRTQGEFITLGQQQWKDVDTAAIFLKNLGYIVVGWGRSMGAVSLLMSNQCDLMISDSAYSNLSSLCKEESSKFLPKACCCIFQCLFPCVFACIQCKVKKLSGLQMQNMNILKRLQNMGEGKQICFIHGQLDTLIPYYHAQKLCESFKGYKQLILFQGTHNSTRGPQILSKCFNFINKSLQKGIKRQLNLSNSKLIEMVSMHVTSKIENSQTIICDSQNHKQQTNQIKVNSSQPYNGLPQNQPNLELRKEIKLKTQQEQYCEIGLNQDQPNKDIPLKDNNKTPHISEQNLQPRKIKKGLVLPKILPVS